MRRINTALAAALIVYLAIACIWYAVSGRIDHDENQFTASAFLIAQYGLHPYQDFAYIHMPNLVYLYALLFHMPYPFMLTRLFAGICALGICLTIFFTARSLFAGQDKPNKLNSLIPPAAFAFLFVHSPLFE